MRQRCASSRYVDWSNNYNSPPGDQADRVRRQLRSWMRRMSGGTPITDLNAALPGRTVNVESHGGQLVVADAPDAGAVLSEPCGFS